MKTLRLLAVLGMALLALAGCVTETTGGFNAKKSDADALKDYIKLANGYLEQNDLVNSKRHLANAAKLDPNNSEIQGIWGLVYAREGEADLADKSFEKALRLDPKNSKARNNYAAFLFASNRYEDAYKQLEKVVEDTQYEARPQAFENLGLAALRLNRPKDAETAFTRAVQLDSTKLRSTLELCGLSLARNDPKQAQAQYRRYLTLLQLYNVPQNARGLWIGVQLEASLGNRDNARTYGKQLQTNFASAPETRLYEQLADSFK
ncbi:MAG TPA: type IV pilus biogenesis/stability protein PilW [Candidatus Acidoferrum sp.]|nr:type IV pilus biogenesis/stability protein PilW [Candidatus Acidoferrum sp.]